MNFVRYLEDLSGLSLEGDLGEFFAQSLPTSPYLIVKEKSISPWFFSRNFQIYFRFCFPGVHFQVVYSTNKQALFQ